MKKSTTWLIIIAVVSLGVAINAQDNHEEHAGQQRTGIVHGKLPR